MNYLPQRHRENLNSPHPPLKLRGGARGRCSASQRLSGGLIVVVLFFLINPFLSNASEIYRWIDDDGVVHITDYRSNIPDKYWEEERVKKEEITPSRKDTQPVVPEPAQTYKEGGTRYPRKIYTKEEIAQYERSKADIPVMEENLKNLNKELEELQRKARIYGVPKKVTECPPMSLQLFSRPISSTLLL